LVLLIFDLGFWAGRISTARWQMEIIHEKGIAPISASSAGSTSVAENPAVKGGARRALENLTSRLELTPAQVSATMPIFIRTGQEMANLPKMSPHRLNVLSRFYEELQPHLTEQQKLLSKDILEKHSQQSPTIGGSAPAALLPRAGTDFDLKGIKHSVSVK
jgi:hypothetical protein